jgi:hypothetical protein
MNTKVQSMESVLNALVSQSGLNVEEFTLQVQREMADLKQELKLAEEGAREAEIARPALDASAHDATADKL